VLEESVSGATPIAKEKGSAGNFPKNPDVFNPGTSEDISYITFKRYFIHRKYLYLKILNYQFTILKFMII